MPVPVVPSDRRDLYPVVFSLDDEANPTYRFEGPEVPGEHAAAARAAVSSCPVAGLRSQS
jgi:ferredoxin